jgi:hypothetical protein
VAPALARLISSAIAVLMTVGPIIDVVSNLEYASKIMLVSNLAGVLIYGLRSSTRSLKTGLAP